MRSVRIVSWMLVLAVMLVPAVILRPSTANAALPTPSIKQITRECESKVLHYILQVQLWKYNDVTREEVKTANADQPAALLDLIDVIYDDKELPVELFEAVVQSCIDINVRAGLPRA
jgi:hypothetical protein